MSRPALAATRAIAVLNFLAAHPTDAFTLSDIAERLEINLASTHALLSVLVDAGYVSRHSRLRTFTLGTSVVALGSAAMEVHPGVDLARDAARDLSAELELEVAVTAAAGDDIVFLARAGAHRARGIAVHVGQRVPLVAPLGAVFMAWASAERIRSWRAGSHRPDDLDAVLAGVRARGYSVALELDVRRGLGEALDHLADAPVDAATHRSVDALLAELDRRDYQLTALDERSSHDVSMIAAPVFGADGEPALAMTLLGFEPGMSAAQVASLGGRLRDVALVVTKQSRGRIPN
ncbi:MAG: transcriptional regulator, IclR family [Ilumatobacteraceae bacterium]|nr:transcriptional regulator, IclR family [Ilumatobacteraceae bacterium]MCU1388103.1 transcriptional regulator, IclR family [Ilumatobacteraceae bacterium]